MALLTPLHVLTTWLRIDFTRSAIGLSMAFAALNLVLVYAIGRRLFERSWVAVAIPLVLCSLDSAFQSYAMSGMENPLTAALALGAVWVWLARPKRMWLWMGVLTALATMSRPDAGLVLGALVLAQLAGFALPLWGRDGMSRRALLIGLGGLSATWLVVYGAYFLWRFQYYGALLPNTFYLKVSGDIHALDRGIEYTLAFFRDRAYLPMAAALALGWIHKPAVRWMLAYVALHLGYVTYVGGDFYSGHRFYIVLIPFFYLLIGVAFFGVQQWIASRKVWRAIRRRTPIAAVCVAIPAGACSVPVFRYWDRCFEQGPYSLEVLVWGDVVDSHIRHMKWLHTIAPPHASALLGNIGAAGFYADVAVVDVYGVVDPVIAHQQVANFGKGKAGHEKRGTDAYLLSKNPTYIPWGWIGGDLRRKGYYVFTDFPPGLAIEGMWVRDDLNEGRYLPHTAIHFNPDELRNWHAEGDAFRAVPTVGAVHHQYRVLYNDGPFINTYGIDGVADRATGRLLSPPINLEGDKMVLNVGGGRDSERLRVSLLIDGKRVFNATGHDFETLGRRVWDIAPFKGSMARIEIVDDKTEGWGHIMVDEIVQWTRGSGATSMRR